MAGRKWLLGVPGGYRKTQRNLLSLWTSIFRKQPREPGTEYSVLVFFVGMGQNRDPHKLKQQPVQLTDSGSLKFFCKVPPPENKHPFWIHFPACVNGACRWHNFPHVGKGNDSTTGKCAFYVNFQLLKPPGKTTTSSSDRLPLKPARKKKQS